MRRPNHAQWRPENAGLLGNVGRLCRFRAEKFRESTQVARMTKDLFFYFHSRHAHVTMVTIKTRRLSANFCLRLAYVRAHTSSDLQSCCTADSFCFTRKSVGCLARLLVYASNEVFTGRLIVLTTLGLGRHKRKRLEHQYKFCMVKYFSLMEPDLEITVILSLAIF
jgi:hypothetical protein